MKNSVVVNTKDHSVGLVVEPEVYEVDTFIKYLMDRGYWIKTDPVPETGDIVLWIRSNEKGE